MDDDDNDMNMTSGNVHGVGMCMGHAYGSSGYPGHNNNNNNNNNKMNQRKAVELPFIPGHEGAGIIVAAGTGTGIYDFRLNDRVGIPWLGYTCGNCEYCETGYENLCPKQLTTGYQIDGCYGEYVLAYVKHLVKIPDNLPFEQACPILCAGVTTYKGLKLTRASAGEWVAIIGAGGGLGHIAVQYAKAMSYKVIGIDIQSKYDFISNLGADLVLDVQNPDIVRIIENFTHGGAHGILCVAADPRAFTLAQRICRRNGVIVSIALPKEKIEIDVANLVMKGISFVGSVVGTRKDMQEAMQFASDGKIVCQTELCHLKDVEQSWHKLLSGKIQGRLVMDICNEIE